MPQCFQKETWYEEIPTPYHDFPYPQQHVKKENSPHLCRDSQYKKHPTANEGALRGTFAHLVLLKDVHILAQPQVAEQVGNVGRRLLGGGRACPDAVKKVAEAEGTFFIEKNGRVTQSKSNFCDTGRGERHTPQRHTYRDSARQPGGGHRPRHLLHHLWHPGSCPLRSSKRYSGSLVQ